MLTNVTQHIEVKSKSTLLACWYLSSTGSLMIDRFITAIDLVLTVTVLT